jgi:HEAT repeats/HEAT repeat
MKIRIKAALVMLFVACLCLVVWDALHPRGLIVRGRPLSTWLLVKAAPHIEPGMYNQAIDAVHEAGTNGLPVMISMLQAQDSPPLHKLKSWLDKQKVLNLHFTRDDERQQAALSGFAMLGPEAAPAAPALGELLSRSNCTQSALAALEKIGTPAVQTLCNALTNASAPVRRAAVMGLFGLCRQGRNAAAPDADLELHVILPRILDCLFDADPDVRRRAAAAMASINSDSPTASLLVLSRLTNWMKDADARVRACALESIGQSAILATLPDGTVLYPFGSAPGSFGQGAKQTTVLVPVLVERLDDPDQDVRKKAAAAFKRLTRVEVWTNQYPGLADKILGN